MGHLAKGVMFWGHHYRGANYDYEVLGSILKAAQRLVSDVSVYNDFIQSESFSSVLRVSRIYRLMPVEQQWAVHTG